MWFEVLPSIGVIFTAMTLGCYATGWVPLLVYGKVRLLINFFNFESFKINVECVININYDVSFPCSRVTGN